MVEEYTAEILELEKDAESANKNSLKNAREIGSFLAGWHTKIYKQSK